MPDDTSVDESSGELHASESSVAGTKDFGERQPMSEGRKEEIAGGVGSSKDIPRPDSASSPASGEDVHEAANRAKSAFGSAADSAPPG